MEAVAADALQPVPIDPWYCSGGGRGAQSVDGQRCWAQLNRQAASWRGQLAVRASHSRYHPAVPTILRDGPYRFFFFSNEGFEPPHVHVQRDRAIAKFWLSSR